jgi:hypothetical protein
LQVTAVEVIELLIEIMDKDKVKYKGGKQSQSGERTDYKPLLLAKLAEKYEVADYRELGIRIGAIGYMIKNVIMNKVGNRAAVSSGFEQRVGMPLKEHDVNSFASLHASSYHWMEALACKQVMDWNAKLQHYFKLDTT